MDEERASPSTRRIPPGPQRRFSKPCTTCRRRKVRCDKVSPCSNCLRANTTCEFESSNEVAVYQVRSPEDERVLQEQLARLERMIEGIANISVTVEKQKEQSPKSDVEESKHQRPGVRISAGLSAEPSINPAGSQIFEPGTSTYIERSFWTSMFEDSHEPRYLLKDPKHDTRTSSIQPTALTLGLRPLRPPVDLASFHPPINQGDLLVNTFFQIVEPFVRVVHEPTFRKELLLFRQHKAPFPEEYECLLFATHALTIAALRSDIVLMLFGESRDILLTRYQFATEEALAKNKFVQSRKILVFQAFLYYITYLFERGEYGNATGLTGLAIRLAQQIGVHREPANFSFSPWVAEMRRRMWNYTYYLDSRGLEIEGVDSGLSSTISDTGLPINASDEKWEACRFAKYGSEPPDGNDFTGMTFAIIRQELSFTLRKITRNISTMTPQDSSLLIQQTRDHLENRFLLHIDEEQPMQKLVKVYSEIDLAKLDIMASAAHSVNSLFLQAITLLENIEQAEKEAAANHWDWVFRSSVQWNATAIVLHNLAYRFDGEPVDRAWNQIEIVFRRHNNAEIRLDGTKTWPALEQLRDRALFCHQLRTTGSSHSSGSQASLTSDASVQGSNWPQNLPLPGDFPMNDMFASQQMFELL
ncbi:hypothetical protein AOQ84DRAFT_333872 [Glonium stellatum]|uniref:Zn(2)-C6 fungal-type domain-containing protein n=1 Tax=Glonium stellatum TaxID=574774 RepID=A0A8E2JWW8_9PEZI|nr:hypothetical protein AOQ84DRAFT_333872 [Glonium stellatum]